MLASAGREGFILLWDVHTTKLGTTITGHRKPVRTLAFSPDGKTLVSGSYDQTLRLWDPRTGEHKAVLQYSDSVTSVAFSPDGKILAVGWGGWQNNRIQLLDAETLQPRETLAGHIEDITDLAFSPDGRILASASCDGTILLWEIEADGRPADVNGDGSVDIDDLTFVADRFGHIGKENAADVNGDGIVNILDLVAVGKKIGKDF